MLMQVPTSLRGGVACTDHACLGRESGAFHASVASANIMPTIYRPRLAGSRPPLMNEMRKCDHFRALSRMWLFQRRSRDQTTYVPECPKIALLRLA